MKGSEYNTGDVVELLEPYFTNNKLPLPLGVIIEVYYRAECSEYLYTMEWPLLDERVDTSMPFWTTSRVAGSLRKVSKKEAADYYKRLNEKKGGALVPDEIVAEIVAEEEKRQQDEKAHGLLPEIGRLRSQEDSARSSFYQIKKRFKVIRLQRSPNGDLAVQLPDSDDLYSVSFALELYKELGMLFGDGVAAQGKEELTSEMG